jgi:hypothetical protein
MLRVLLTWLLRYFNLLAIRVQCDHPGCHKEDEAGIRLLPDGWTAVGGEHFCPRHRLRGVG